jgi:tRNA A37 threonylcarbamoyladenosine dehydratase
MPDRFERSILLYGEAAVRRFSQCRVAVIGIGGVGSYTAEALARSGFGYLRLVDNDTVELSNCNRQLWALESTVGKYKVTVAAERLKDVNPSLTVDAHPERFCSDTADELLGGSLGFVVDAIDSVPDKIELIRRCIVSGIPVVSCMGAARRKDPTLVRFGDLFEPTGCPLARKMRRELRRQGIQGPVPIVYSEEPAAPIEPGSALPSCCAVPAAVGMAAAAYVCNKVFSG